MSKLFSLLRAIMSEGIQLFNYRAKNQHAKRLMPILLSALMGTIILVGAVSLTTDLKATGSPTAILSLYTLITVIIIVTEGIYKSSDLLFRPRDNDTLLAMPIRKSTIVLARMLKFYVFELIYCLIFLLPAIIAYAMNVEANASYYLVAATMLLLVPIIPIAISCIIGLFTSAISSRFKHRTFFQVFLSFAFLFATTILVLRFNATSDFDGQSLVAIGNKINEFYYPAKVFTDLATHFDLGQFLIFIGINLAVLLVAVLIISRFYFQLVSRLSVTKLIKNTEAHYEFKRRTPLTAFVKKELNRYFSTPVLIVNTAIGLVLFLVVVGALCLKYDDLVASIMSSIEDFPLTADDIRSFLPSITFALVAFASLMTFITATMISLEGKAFNMLKSLPISGKKVIMAKVLSAMLLIVPATLLGSIVMFVRFQFSALDIILILIGVFAMPFVAELIGILVNLKYARFDAESDAVAVKQSASVMVATFLGLGMVMVVIPLTLATVYLAGQTVGLIIMDAVFVIVSAFLYFAVATRGEEKYSQISA